MIGWLGSSAQVVAKFKRQIITLISAIRYGDQCKRVESNLRRLLVVLSASRNQRIAGRSSSRPIKYSMVSISRVEANTARSVKGQNQRGWRMALIIAAIERKYRA